MRLRITIHPRRDVLDPEGRAVESALHGLGHRDVSGVRVGRIVELELPDGVAIDEAEARATAMCDALLANPVIETYHIEACPNTDGDARGCPPRSS